VRSDELATGHWAIGIDGVRSASAVTHDKGGVVMREGPSNSESQAQARGLGAGAIASLTGMGLLLIFMLQNTESVRLDFLFWGFTWPLWLLTLASAFLGALVWFGLGVMRRHRRRKERRAERRG